MAWIRYIDNAGYIEFDEFMSLPPSMLHYIMSIRAADSLKLMRKELVSTRDEGYKKKLNSNIKELEAFFYER